MVGGALHHPCGATLYAVYPVWLLESVNDDDVQLGDNDIAALRATEL